jgi:PhnB protein
LRRFDRREVPISRCGALPVWEDAPLTTKELRVASRLNPYSGFTLMGADTPPGVEHNPGNNIAVSLSGDDADELRSYWEQLSGNGNVTIPLEKQMWGDEFGMCIDRFGIAWMVNIGQPQA